MDFVFHIGGMPFNGETISKGESLGGSETSGYYLAKEIAKKGHTVKVFGALSPEQAGEWDGVKYFPAGEVNDQFPLGHDFTQYAKSIPIDVLYIQRNPVAFKGNYKSKLNVWATHDLAMKRTLPHVNSQMWNVDFVTCVSQWHKDQVKDVYEFKEEHIKVVPNGVDTSLYEVRIDVERKFSSKNILFTSRPERGLLPLVKPGGIMEKLWSMDPEIKLFVTFYTLFDGPNREAYQFMLNRCRELPNVNLISPMGKKELATLEQNCALYVYPTLFEDTSCITAMSGQINKTPFISCETGALPETLDGGGNIFLKENPDTEEGVNAFAQKIFDVLENKDAYYKLTDKCYADKYTWEKSADILLSQIEDAFKEKTKDKKKLFRHLTKYSDVIDAKKLKITRSKIEQEYISKNFGFLNNEKKYQEYYDQSHYGNLSEGNNHNIGNYEYFDKMPRLQPIIKDISELKPGSAVLDFGCCVGHQTTYLAKKFPHVFFVGADIAQEALDYGNNFIKDNNIENCALTQSEAALASRYDYIICAEVLEHVSDYEDIVHKLEGALKETGKVSYTVPSNLPETGNYEHVRHFEPEVVEKIFGKKKGFNGSIHNYGDWESIYFSYEKDQSPLGPWPHDYKILVQNPEQEVSTCIITENNPGGLSRCIESSSHFTSEFIVGVDCKKEEKIDPVLLSLFKQYDCKYFKLSNSPSNPEFGFGAARNEVIKKAKKDWVFWIDDDEFVVNPWKVKIFLRDNQYDSYGVAQTHFSMDPKGAIKTDYPNRLFRNNKGIKFFGYVHEHPETEINKGAGKTFLIPENIFNIVHFGYETELVRRKRFERNLPLIVKDREENPERDLGKFLWMRDLIHLNRFKAEKGSPVDSNMINRAREVLNIFDEFLSRGKTKIVQDSAPYVNEAVALLTKNNPIEIRFSFDANYGVIGDNKQNPPQTIAFNFEKKEKAEEFMSVMVKEKLNYFDSKYL